ncbi:TetR/AcrR family transcriptional regulator [Streptomyces sp. CRN 30]|uniref:TetR/AcrR family transcriptional regulator n=1 Tax=Streptomyces sp. CRN 30 TaxID=3075613 RepID=UPI002A82874D|nr:TetR/AcrR family transcriptional regulator [Streptomyces sp. CRN 30]
MSPTTANPSARRTELLEASYAYALTHGLAGLSLRPLAEAIGSSTRVLMFLFGNKDGLVRALLERARADELALLASLRDTGRPAGLPATAERVWTWLSAPAHRPLLRLWAEAYARSLVEPEGPWAGFARATVDDWLGVLAASEEDEVRRTLALAVLRGALLDLLATGDEERVGSAVRLQLALLSR